MRMKKLGMALLCVLVSLSLYMPVQAAEVYSDGYFYYHVYEGYNSICGYFGTETTVTVPSFIAGRPVSRIEAGAFDGCNTIEKLVLPDTIMEIEEGAFSGAKNLTAVEDASGVWKQQDNPPRPSGGNNEYNGNKGGLEEIGDYEYEEPEEGEASNGQESQISGEPSENGQKSESGNGAGQRGQKPGSFDSTEGTDSTGRTDSADRTGFSVIGTGILIAAGVICVFAVAVGVRSWRKRRG